MRKAAKIADNIFFVQKALSWAIEYNNSLNLLSLYRIHKLSELSNPFIAGWWLAASICPKLHPTKISLLTPAHIFLHM
jgi:hypothetical protein